MMEMLDITLVLRSQSLAGPILPGKGVEQPGSCLLGFLQHQDRWCDPVRLPLEWPSGLRARGGMPAVPIPAQSTASSRSLSITLPLGV